MKGESMSSADFKLLWLGFLLIVDTIILIKHEWDRANK